MLTAALVSLYLVNNLHRRHTLQSRENCLGPGAPPGGGGTQLANVYTGRLRPEVQPLTLSHTIFHKKGTPFVYLLLTNATPFTYLV